VTGVAARWRPKGLCGRWLYGVSATTETAASTLARRSGLCAAEISMNGYFQRQLVYYAEAHRDRVNGVMHILGNPIIFIGVVLPLCRVPVTLFGVETSLAPILVIPALLLWTLWDVGLGLAIVVAAIPLLFIAAAIAASVSMVWVWIIAVVLFVLGWVLQVIGHQVFEGKRPTLLDNPVQMLISPMYIFAKLFIALGFRPDLAAILRTAAQPTSLGTAANVGRNP
jgi:uncharacterized membrane protein YGL010W